MTSTPSFANRAASWIDWMFGFAAVMVLVAVCSVIPALNLLSLGYLLHVSGAVARSGKWRDGFIGVRKASVIGSAAAGAWVVMWPARIASEFWRDAETIAADSHVVMIWKAGTLMLFALTLIHIVWACLRGGRWWHFLWPAPLKLHHWLKSADSFSQVNQALHTYVLGLRLPFYFWLGVRGFAGALAWLGVPAGILFTATRMPPGGALALSLFGGLLLLFVVIHLPFLQAHLAETQRFQAIFDIREVRRRFLRAPIAFCMAFFITVLLAVPLYLLKIELTPRELSWLPALLFVICIFPARLLTGWAISRAQRREAPQHGFWRWTARLGIFPMALAYVIVVYAAPYLSWNGVWSLLEQHAFLVPAPLLAL
jgi:hypothetical protein